MIDLAYGQYLESRFVAMDSPLRRALRIGERLKDVTICARSRYWLATSLEWSARQPESLALWMQVIAAGYRDADVRALEADGQLHFVAGSFARASRILVRAGAGATEASFRLIDEGFEWLRRVRRPGLAANLHLAQSEIRRDCDELPGAVEAAEAGLAIKRRYNSPGYWLAVHLYQLAALLRRDEVRDLPRARRLAEEALERPANELSPDARSRYLVTYARILSDLGETEAAVEAAGESLRLSSAMDYPSSMVRSAEALARVLLEGGKLADTPSYAAIAWRQARRPHALWSDAHLAAIAASEVRLAQADDSRDESSGACGLVCQSKARTRLRSAQGWLDRAEPVARRMDALWLTGSNMAEIQRLRAKADAIACSLTEQSAPT